MMSAKILVADDNRNIRTVVKMDLESLGYLVLEATDGIEALKLIRQHRPDLVVLDVMMPGKDGYEVCFELRNDPEIRSTPVVMLTAKTTKEDKFLGREVGADEYMTKPFDPEELEKVIERILDARRKGEADHPLTGLPMWQAVKNEIARRKERKEEFVVMDGSYETEPFDLFNKKYGTIKADEAIRATADILKEVTARWPGFYLGHTGDNVFIFIAPPGIMEQAREGISLRLAETVPFFYDEADQRDGGITLKQPNEAGRKVSLMKWVWRADDTL
jgi:DNA-binding response OmpR family regulator